MFRREAEPLKEKDLKTQVDYTIARNRLCTGLWYMNNQSITTSVHERKENWLDFQLQQFDVILVACSNSGRCYFFATLLRSWLLAWTRDHFYLQFFRKFNGAGWGLKRTTFLYSGHGNEVKFVNNITNTIYYLEVTVLCNPFITSAV